MADFPERAEYFAIKKYHYPGYTGCQRQQPQPAVVSRSQCGWPGKTGHTDAAGYCLIATARRDLVRPGHAQPGPRGTLCATAAVYRAGGRQRQRPCQRIAKTAELGFHGVRCRQTVRCGAGRCAVQRLEGVQPRSNWVGQAHCVVVPFLAHRAQAQDPGGSDRSLVAPSPGGPGPWVRSRCFRAMSW